ncbi:hypothetical protein [Aureimonas glaciei]|uniref:Uncharacterized protein n=1 Tax=Aureimonas glaciei TaxID=1776957 RepID=A0A916V1H5_9HYPH|nr:hypothetical protein [Aureimonas glaciei]GGD01748.1 hypothetical protein GCM10011335_00370 [Aureimonas glaciei]
MTGFVKEMDAWNAPEIGRVLRTRGRLHIVTAVEKTERRFEAVGMVTEIAGAACRVTLRPLTPDELSARRAATAKAEGATVTAAPRFCGRGN